MEMGKSKSRGKRNRQTDLRPRKYKRGREEKAYFHILLDPWLRGSQSDVAQFFSQRWHAQESACQSITDAENIIYRIEELASSQAHSTSVLEKESGISNLGSPIDAVVISHEFTDHMHKGTLLEVHPSVPVFASPKAASIIQSWKHFSTVHPLPSLTPRSTDWRTTSILPLPTWLGIGRLAKDGVDLLYYHSAVLITFSSSLEPSGVDGPEYGKAEAVVYTPHGITVEDLSPLTQSSPPVQTLALLHGLQDVKVSAGQLNLGAHNGLKVQRSLGARYWIGTHDEVTNGRGLVAWLLKRELLTVKEALEREAEMSGEDFEKRRECDVLFEDVGNGESLILA